MKPIVTILIIAIAVTVPQRDRGIFAERTRSAMTALNQTLQSRQDAEGCL